MASPSFGAKPNQRGLPIREAFFVFRRPGRSAGRAEGPGPGHDPFYENPMATALPPLLLDQMATAVTLQISIDGGPFNTLTSAGAGNGWSSSTPLGSNITAGPPGTTYQFRTWAIDNNVYQSRITTSPLYTTVAAVPPTGYQLPDGTDLNAVFKGLSGGNKAPRTGLTCVINGTTYDFSDLFQPRSSAARGDVGFTAANGSDLASIFEPK